MTENLNIVPEAKDMTCAINVFIDDENKVYTIDYTFHSEEAMYHSETTIIFKSQNQCCVYLAALRKKCAVNHILIDEMIEVI